MLLHESIFIHNTIDAIEGADTTHEESPYYLGIRKFGVDVDVVDLQRHFTPI
jgi:hypothetical protein